MYNKKSGFNPDKAYDLAIAKAVLKDAHNS
jgi:hypothetical protein